MSERRGARPHSKHVNYREVNLLTDRDIAHFKEQGFVVLPDFIDTEHIDAWNEQFWNHVAANPNNAAGWPDNYVIDGFSTDPLFGHLPQMKHVVEQLGGGRGEVVLQGLRIAVPVLEEALPAVLPELTQLIG